jgi:hypothetical protein
VRLDQAHRLHDEPFQLDPCVGGIEREQRVEAVGQVLGRDAQPVHEPAHPLKLEGRVVPTVQARQNPEQVLARLDEHLVVEELRVARPEPLGPLPEREEPQVVPDRRLRELLGVGREVRLPPGDQVVPMERDPVQDPKMAFWVCVPGVNCSTTVAQRVSRGAIVKWATWHSTPPRRKCSPRCHLPAL